MRSSRPLPSRLFLLTVFGAGTLGCSVFEEPIQSEGPLQASDSGSHQQGDDAGNPPLVKSDAGEDAASDASSSDAASSSSPDAGTDASTPAPDAGEKSCQLMIDLMDECANSDIVINEIDGSGEDFVEIYNRGDSPVNISGYVIADDSAGAPAVAEGAVIPAGTVLDPKRFLYLWANLPPEAEPNPGLLYQNCIPGTPSPCLHAEWGVSAGGERIYLLNDKLEVICAVTYNGVYGGEALGRIPDGSNALCPTNPTAGESNVVSSLR
ncbi:MAG: lamin tail domain-containing protein [Myxococcales bacterium]